MFENCFGSVTLLSHLPLVRLEFIHGLQSLVENSEGVENSSGATAAITEKHGADLDLNSANFIFLPFDKCMLETFFESFAFHDFDLGVLQIRCTEY